MTLTALVLVIVSATLHAGWNLLSKHLLSDKLPSGGRPGIGFFFIASSASVVVLAPVAWLHADSFLHFSPQLWTLLIITGAFQALYYCGLAGAYSRGALSVAYPLARSLPVLFVLAVTGFQGRADSLSGMAVTGMLLIVAGALVLPLDRWNAFRLKNYLHPACAFAVLAAMGTAGYSLIDDAGMRILTQDTQPGTLGGGGFWSALLYLLLSSFFTVCWLGILLLFSSVSADRHGRHGKHARYASASHQRLWCSATVTGIVISITYGLVLLAMTHASHVGYVVALRQLSIPLGALAGFVLLHETPCATRIVGVCMLCAGLLMVALG